MKRTLLFASAPSKLQIDLILTRIRQAGLALDGITAIYRETHRPNSVPCWLEGAAVLRLSTGETAVAAGALRYEFVGSQGPAALRAGLRNCGLTSGQGANLEDSLLEGRTLLCLEADDEAQFAVIFHILLHVGAEKIVAVGEPARKRRRARKLAPVLRLPAAVGTGWAAA